MSEEVRILIVEDDPLIAMDLVDELTDRGFVAARVANVAKAREAMEANRPSIAILDMYLRSEPSFELAADLRAAGVPFFFLSGNDASSLPPDLASVTIVTKPVRMEDVVSEVESLLGS